jgi:hypothetical protein
MTPQARYARVRPAKEAYSDSWDHLLPEEQRTAASIDNLIVEVIEWGDEYDLTAVILSGSKATLETSHLIPLTPLEILARLGE